MGAATIGFGLAMIALGVIAYFASGQESWTALIPAIFGVVLAICGGIALKRPMPGVIAAVVVAALGLAGVLPRLIPTLAQGEGIVLATAVQLVMAIAMTIFLIVGARWIWRLQKGYGQQRRMSVAPGSTQQ